MHQPMHKSPLNASMAHSKYARNINQSVIDSSWKKNDKEDHESGWSTQKVKTFKLSGRNGGLQTTLKMHAQ